MRASLRFWAAMHIYYAYGMAEKSFLRVCARTRLHLTSWETCTSQESFYSEYRSDLVSGVFPGNSKKTRERSSKKILVLGEVLILSFTSAFPPNPSKFHSGPFRHPSVQCACRATAAHHAAVHRHCGRTYRRRCTESSTCGSTKAAQPCTGQQMA